MFKGGLVVTVLVPIAIDMNTDTVAKIGNYITRKNLQIRVFKKPLYNKTDRFGVRNRLSITCLKHSQLLPTKFIAVFFILCFKKKNQNQ